MPKMMNCCAIAMLLVSLSARADEKVIFQCYQ